MRKATLEEFIEKSRAKYGDKYSFPDAVYINNKTPIKIHCNICGKDFIKRPDEFLFRGSECFCQTKPKILPDTRESFIEKLEKIFGKDAFGYDRLVYINTKTEVELLCKKCGKYFKRQPQLLLRGKGYDCPCQTNYGLDDFIKRANEVYKEGEFDYSLSEYVNFDTKMKIIDCDTGKVFLRTPRHHLRGSGSPYKNESKGEYLVKTILTELGYTEFEKEYSVLGKIEGRSLNKYVRIDFRLLIEEKEYWIEYNGSQHYNFYESFWKRATKSDDYETNVNEYKYQLKRDENVRKYCKENNINLIEIPYTVSSLKKLRKILGDILLNGAKPEDIIKYPEIQTLGLD